MKKMINIIVVSILILFTLTNQVFAYLGDDYSVDIPSGYEEISEGSFYDDNGNSISFEMQSAGRLKFDEDEIYTDENMDKLLTEICSKLYNGVKITVVERDITRFTENEYECFMFVLKFNSFGMDYYYKCYCSIDDNKIFALGISSTEYKYFDSSEIEKMIDSLTIEDFVGRKQEIEQIWKNIFLIGGILIGLIILYGIYNKARQKVIYDKTQLIIQKQELAKKNAERELKRNLDIKDSSRNDIKTFSNQSNEESTTGFSTKNPNLTNRSFDVRDNSQKNVPTFTTSKKVEKKVCPNCEKENDAFWIFCNYCGHKLNDE